MIDEYIDGFATARPALAELLLIQRSVPRARRRIQLERLEEDAGMSLDAVEMDPLASDDAVRLVRQTHTEIVAAIARRMENLS